MAWWLATFGAQQDIYQAASASAAQAKHPLWTIAGPFASKAAAQGNASGSSGGGAASGPGPGGDYSYAQLEGLWINAGGTPAMAPIMAAIAEAESRGNPNATGGVGEKGLWQINPNAWGSLATYDPAGNAAAAVHVLAVQGLTAWSTYTSGAYRAFLSNSTTPNTNVSSPAGGTGGAGTGTATLAAQNTRCLVGGNTFIPCLLDASQARGIIGGLCVFLGGALFLGGIVLMTAIAAQKSGVAAALPGPAGQVVGQMARRGYATRRSDSGEQPGPLEKA